MSKAEKAGDFDVEQSQEYVDAVMASQGGASTTVDASVETIDASQSQSPSLLQQGKKRNLSEPDTIGSTIKKAKGEQNDAGNKPTLKPRRLLSDGKADKRSERRKGKATVISDNSDASTNELISIMSDNMKTMFEDLNRKVDTMASDIENRLSKKFSQLIDKRISNELSKMTREINSRIDTVKSDIYKEFDELEAQVKDISSVKSDLGPNGDIDLRIVLRNVPESRDENVIDKVNGVIREGLKLRDVKVVKAERKQTERQTGRNSKPPVIVASFESAEDKRAVMTNKKMLKDDRNKHKHVFIHNDQTKAERVQRANFQTILDSLKNNGSSNLQMRGSRVIRGAQDCNDNTGINERQSNRRDRSDNHRSNRSRDTSGDRARNRDTGRDARDNDRHVPRSGADRSNTDAYRNRSQPRGRSRR